MSELIIQPYLDTIAELEADNSRIKLLINEKGAEIEQLKSDKALLVEAMIRIRPKASWFMVGIIDDTLKQMGENK